MTCSTHQPTDDPHAAYLWHLDRVHLSLVAVYDGAAKAYRHALAHHLEEAGDCLGDSHVVGMLARLLRRGEGVPTG